jgi:type I restriction enzyme S subunit
MSTETIHMVKKNTLVPALRFKEFDGEWELELLGDTCVVKTGGSDTQNRVDDGAYPFFVRSNTVERINTFSFDGEAILTSGDGVGVGKNFHYINGKFDFHQRVYALREFKENYSGKFIYQVFVEKFYKRVIRLSAKNSVDSVRMSMITEMKMHFPSLPEQQKIASFLSAVDEKILQLTKKKELLEHYKNGVMQKLFSGKLRFKDENGKDYPDWEEKRLGEIAKRVALKNTKNEINFVLTNSATQGIVSQLDYFDKDIANQNNLEGYYIVSVDDFVYNPRISVHAPVGPIKRNKLQKGVMSPLYSVFRFKEDNLEYFERYFETIGWHKYLNSVANFGARHDRMNISQSDFFKMPIPMPSDEERQKIASYLLSIDTKIASVNHQITQTQTFKKGLLKQMFVAA